MSVRRHVVVARWLRSCFDPEAATAAVLSLIAVVALVGGALFGVVLAMVRTHRGFARLDTSAARFGAAHATTASTEVLRVVTQLGGAYLIVPIACVVALLEWRRRRKMAPLAFMAAVVGGQYVLADTIKAIVHRARPDLLRLTGFSGPSFPSGHATASAAVFAAAALLIGTGRTQSIRTTLAGVAVGLAVLVGETRIVLGVHWLTDVLAGWCLGWMWFAVSSIAFGGRRLRFGAPAVTASQTIDDISRRERLQA